MSPPRRWVFTGPSGNPGGVRPGGLGALEHVVLLMQENRSFDHYYGTLRGVRGYGDRDPAQMLAACAS